MNFGKDRAYRSDHLHFNRDHPLNIRKLITDLKCLLNLSLSTIGERRVHQLVFVSCTSESCQNKKPAAAL